MKMMKIIGCSDPQMWYRDKVGEIVPFLYEDETYFWSREPAGYKNIVKKRDGLVFEVSVSTLQKHEVEYLIDVVNKADCKKLVRTTYDLDLEQAIKARIVSDLMEVLT